ncbi:MAG TPA: hypothetical protein VFX56_13265 [Nitrospira sp.]|nr:hypothetical protein [Nitrospira sp.]
MTCLRCQGLMVEAHLFDYDGSYGHMWATSFRCMNCGHVHDSVITENSKSHPVKAKVLVGVSAEPDYQDDEVHLGAETFLRHAA